MSVAPATALGGEAISVSGAGILPGATVTVDGRATVFLSAFSSGVRVFLPFQGSGAVDVVVTNPGGDRQTLAGGFTFQVVTISAGAAQVAAGAQISVTWAAPPGRSQFDWIELAPVGGACESGVWTGYLSGAATGTRAVTAPSVPGEYEFRYMVDDGCVVVGRSGGVTVSGFGGQLELTLPVIK